jgi:hypothetical protein
MQGSTNTLIDFDLLNAQILSNAPAAALPCNLTDEWLTLISSELENTLGRSAPQNLDFTSLLAPLALVYHLLTGRNSSGDDGPWSLEYLFARVTDYRLEIALELLNRGARVPYTPATIDDIFFQNKVDLEIIP